MQFLKYLEEAKVPPQLIPEALEYLESCERRYADARVGLHKLAAPFVIAWLLLTNQVKFEDEHLPEKWRKWDNDVSINGDRGVWLMSEDGYAEMQPVPLDDSALQYAYYAKGHQRGKWARWVWLGTRNMCSRYASDLGPAITPEMRGRLRSWGEGKTDRGTPGVVVHELDGHWCIYVIQKAPFGLVVRRNMGVKLAMAVANMRRRAPLVMIKWSLLRAKKGA